MELSLFGLTGQYKNVENMIYDDEFDMQCIQDTLDGIVGEIEHKAEGYCCIMSKINGDRDSIKKEIERLKAIDDRLSKGEEKLKNNLMYCMKETGLTKIDTGKHRLSIAKNGGKQKLIVHGDVPDEYLKVIFEKDNERIRKDLESGKELDFAYLEERGESLRIK